MNTPRTNRCCVITSEKKICAIAATSLVTSATTFFITVGYIIYVTGSKVVCSHDIMVASHFLSSLVTLCLTVYQLVLSALLLDYSLSCCSRGNPYVVIIWHISHVTILPINWALYLLEIFICFIVKKYIIASIVTIITFLYQGLYTYFVVLTYSYITEHHLIM